MKARTIIVAAIVGLVAVVVLPRIARAPSRVPSHIRQGRDSSLPRDTESQF